MTRWVRPIRHSWVIEGGVPGPDVDEFAEATEVVAALAGPRGGALLGGRPGRGGVGVLCLVDSAAVDVHGISRVRHSEQVYPEVVVERAAVLAGLGCATSAAMLVPVVDGEQLTAVVLRSIDALGAPAVSTPRPAHQCD